MLSTRACTYQVLQSSHEGCTHNVEHESVHLPGTAEFPRRMYTRCPGPAPWHNPGQLSCTLSATEELTLKSRSKIFANANYLKLIECKYITYKECYLRFDGIRVKHLQDDNSIQVKMCLCGFLE